MILASPGPVRVAYMLRNPMSMMIVGQEADLTAANYFLVQIKTIPFAGPGQDAVQTCPDPPPGLMVGKDVGP
jgi:hypothetical protein